jgi:hypothetical protein
MSQSPQAPPFDAAWMRTVFLVPEPPPVLPARFAVVTAHNPGGRVGGAEENAARERELDELVRSEGIASFAVTGAAPDLSHREAGRGLVTGDLELAARIAARFGQLGFFWIEDGVAWICCDASGRGWKMARWEERVVAG